MKREDVKAKIPGITDEQLNWLMSENGADINREKTVAEQFKTQFENAQAQLKTAQDGLAKFDGKKTPEEYEAEGAELREMIIDARDIQPKDSETNTSASYLKKLADRGATKLFEQLRSGSIEMTLDADGLEPGDVCFCSPPQQKSSPRVGLREELFVPVVGAALDDLDHAAINAVDDPVCIVDAAAPIAGQIAAEALGLADALIAVAVDVLQKL